MKIEEKALKRYSELDDYTEQEYHEICCARTGFIDGAKWMLAKAENWLTNAKQYINPNDEGAATAFVNAFKKELE